MKVNSVYSPDVYKKIMLADSDKKDDIDKTVRKEKEEIYNKIYEAYSEVFKYMEKVLYSGYETNVKEYNDFYSKIQILK